MSIDNNLKDTVKLLKLSVERMSKQREALQLEIKRLQDLTVNYRQRAKDLANEIVALGITADNADTKIKQHLEELVKLDEEMRELHAHLSDV